MTNRAELRGLHWAALFGLSFVVVACSAGHKPSAPVARSIPVVVETVAQKSFPLQLTAIGHADSYQSVAVKPQVQGQLVSVQFTPGQEVRSGQVLFKIDPRPYQATLSKSEAVLAKDQALAAQSANDEKKTEELVQKGFAPQEQLDTDKATLASLQSQVKADEAQVDNDRLQLTYCTISAPISGRTGALQVDVGNIVAADATVLVTINQLSPIYVDFSLPEQSLVEVKKYMATGSPKIQAEVPGIDKASLDGKLVFIDNAVDSTTGTFLLKGSFDNRGGVLWPGQYVNVVLDLSSRPNAIVIPTQALQSGQNGQFVFVVKGDKTVEMRPVNVESEVAGEVAIAQGLKAGETVVTDGQLLLVPGSAVDIKNAAASPSPAPGGSGRATGLGDARPSGQTMGAAQAGPRAAILAGAQGG